MKNPFLFKPITYEKIIKVKKEEFNEELFELLREMYEDKYEKYIEEMEYD